jgi:hypothetical protein
MFVVFLIMMFANTFAGWREPSEQGPVTSAVFWFNITIWTWIPVYLLVSLKRVYQQNWWLTVAKFSCIGISYMILLALATSLVALISFVSL